MSGTYSTIPFGNGLQKKKVQVLLMITAACSMQMRDRQVSGCGQKEVMGILR